MLSATSSKEGISVVCCIHKTSKLGKQEGSVHPLSKRSCDKLKECAQVWMNVDGERKQTYKVWPLTSSRI